MRCETIMSCMLYSSRVAWATLACGHLLCEGCGFLARIPLPGVRRQMVGSPQLHRLTKSSPRDGKEFPRKKEIEPLLRHNISGRLGLSQLVKQRAIADPEPPRRFAPASAVRIEDLANDLPLESGSRRLGDLLERYRL